MSGNNDGNIFHSLSFQGQAEERLKESIRQNTDRIAMTNMAMMNSRGMKRENKDSGIEGVVNGK